MMYLYFVRFDSKFQKKDEKYRDWLHKYFKYYTIRLLQEINTLLLFLEWLL